MNKIHFVMALILLLFCTKHHDAIHLNYCQDSNDTTITRDSNGLIHPNPQPALKAGLQEPCFEDSLGDTILIKWTIPINDSIIIELLNQNEDVIRIIENRSLVKGSYAFPIRNNRDNQIYGIRMEYGTYDNTIWFYEN